MRRRPTILASFATSWSAICRIDVGQKQCVHPRRGRPVVVSKALFRRALLRSAIRNELKNLTEGPVQRRRQHDGGRPRYQVPRFQMMAAMSNANTIAKPAALPTCRISSTGNSDTIPNATAPDETSTPRKLKNPDHTTAIGTGRECV